MGDYDTSGLMGDLSLTGSPDIRRNYEESNLLDDDSYEMEMRQAQRLSGGEGGKPLDIDYGGAGMITADQTIMRAGDASADANRGEMHSNAHTRNRRASSSPGDAQREERLKAALFELKKMNTVFENYANALEASRHHNERLARRTAQTSQLLDQYVALLSQTEHTQRLILDKRWTGLTDDTRLAEEEERMRIEEEYRRQQEEELNRQRELDLQQQREREREAKERAATLANNSALSMQRPNVSRLGMGRGTRGTTVSGTRGTTRGRVASGAARSASSSVPASATGISSGIRKPSGSFANVKSSGYGPPRTRQA
ncbi:hypothetical protein NliqN6_1216 [Naganishia liquefaciens]|uniref:DASH complex subunit DUO1 n=1 Tax=Naganishia liquefaciens TaxID=104408 RepID=A0A8H3TR93_9TREE|nr:hypothetical protein NliqN6_1216 [Naganishia liquefaciens]